VDPIDIIGNDDDPRQINSRDSIKAILANPERRHIYLKERGPPSPPPAPRQPRPPSYEDEPASQVYSQRRPLTAEEAARWAKVDRDTYNESQIDPQTQGMLASDRAWYQPGDIEGYKQRAGKQEEEAPSGNVAPVVRTDGRPPDLASPESSPVRARDSLVYQTQAVPVDSQSNGEVARENVPVVEPTQVETSEEQAFEWEATPPPEPRQPEEPLQFDQPRNDEHPETVPSPEGIYESRVLPASILGPLQKDAPPSLNSDDEGSDNESAVSDALEEKEQHEEPASQEVVFNEDAEREPEPIEDGVEEMVVEEPPPPSMVVSTAQILSQHVDSAGELSEIVEVSETIEEPSQIVQKTSVEIVHDTEEEMQDVQQPASNITQVSVSVEKEDVPKEGSSRDFVVPGTLLADQSTSTVNDGSTPTQYPNSTPSNPTQQPTQSQIQTQSEEPSRPTTAQPILPPPPLPARSTSPPKATPTTPIQIQVQETPLPLQRPQTPTAELVSSAVRATAPLAGKRPAPDEEAPGRKHKRDRHVGPIVPRFSRREKKRNWDLEAILLEDRRRWMAEHLIEPVHREEEIVVLEEEVVVEEVIEMEPVKEQVVEQAGERPKEQAEAQIEEEREREEVMEDVKVTRREEVVMEIDPPAQQQEAIIFTEEEDVIEIPEIEPEPIEQPAEPPPHPTPQPSLATKWGRFAAHWRRFTPFVQQNQNT
jgi:hypothetical protein